jgi:hypothetical protein
MVAHMKTTIELPDALLEEAKCRARERGVTLKAIIEDALRRELAREEPKARFKLRDASVGGDGMAEEFVKGGWPAIRDEIYRGHGA